MPAIQPAVAGRPALHASTFVVTVGDDTCTVRATGVQSIAYVLAPPEAELLGIEEMEAFGAMDDTIARDTPPGRAIVGGMIAAPRLRRRQRTVSSRAMFFGAPRS